MHAVGRHDTGRFLCENRAVVAAVIADDDAALLRIAAFGGNVAPLAALWVFIVGPMVGAALAAVCYKVLEND